MEDESVLEENLPSVVEQEPRAGTTWPWVIRCVLWKQEVHASSFKCRA